MSWSAFPAGPAGRPPRFDAFKARAARAFDRALDFTRDFRVGAERSWRVIHALIRREARTRYGRRSAGYVWALLVPLLQLTVMATIFQAVGRGVGAGDNMVIFFLTGIIPVFLWRNCAVRGSNAIASNRSLMIYPQVRAFEVVTARTMLEMLTSLVVFLIIMLAMFAFGDTPLTDWLKNPLQIIFALGALTLLCYGSAYLSSQIGRAFPPWNEITSAMGRLLFFLSGVWYTLGSLPTGPRQWMLYNPLAHVIEWIRHAAIHDFQSDHFNAFYPIAFGFVCLALGLFMDWLYRLAGYEADA